MTDELVMTFVAQNEAVSGKPHIAATVDEAANVIVEVIQGLNATHIAMANLPASIMSALETRAEKNGLILLKEPFAARDLPNAIDSVHVGITGMAFGIAQSGTVAEVVLNDANRLVSALPRIHIAVVSAADLVATIDDAAPRLRRIFEENSTNCVVSFITGPSRTGDIELKLTLGVHGPGEAHVVIIQEQS